MVDSPSRTFKVDFWSTIFCICCCVISFAFFAYWEDTTQTIETIKISTIMRCIFGFFSLVLIIFLWRFYKHLIKVLGTNLDDVFFHISCLGNGDFTQSITVKPGMENSVIGWVAELQAKLAKADVERKQAENEIWRQANFDVLTNLPNRRMFYDRLAYEAKKSLRSNLPMVLLVIDLDYFKEVNDTYGHDAGDVLLIEAAKRINSCVRETDTVARLGGDEFTVILPDIQDKNTVNRIAENIIEKLTLAFDIGVGVDIFVSASIGIAEYPKDGGELDELYKNADQAMYVSKRVGRNCFNHYAC